MFALAGFGIQSVGRTTMALCALASFSLACACSQAGITAHASSSSGGSTTNNPDAPGGIAGTGSSGPARGTVGGPGNHYTLVGRFDTSMSDRLTYSFANSKVGARFSATTSVSVNLADNGNDSYLAVLDGNDTAVLSPAASSDPQQLLIASGLDPTLTHTLWLIKRTEGHATANDNSGQATGTASFFGFVLDAGGVFADPPQTQARLIEAIGDSGFTGYGDANASPSGQPTCTFTPSSEDATYSVPALTASLLGAEVVNISAAGLGVASSVYNSDDNAQIPALYQQTVPPSPTPAWGFDDPQVDLVVIEAGSNDLAGTFGNGSFPDTNVFISTYTQLLATVRAHRPNAPILCVLTPSAYSNDKTTLMNAMNAAVAARLAQGDTQVSTYDFFANDPNNWTWYGDASAAIGLGSGCEGHPSEAGAAFLAQRLAAKAKTLVSWGN